MDDFFSRLVDHLQDCTMIPRVQVERAVGPILGLFLAEVLSETFRDDEQLSGGFTMVCPEFPLRKADNNESKSVDWLMVNNARRCLVLVELKTADSSGDALQSATYRTVQAEVRKQGGGFLVDDVVRIRDASNEHGKYRFILDEKIAPHVADIRACRDAFILYIAPRTMGGKLQGYGDRIINFSSLAATVPGPDAEHWQTLHGMLRGLDDVSRTTRNRGASASNSPSHPAREKKWAGTFRFDEMVQKCQLHGGAVVIGFKGGSTAFKNTPLDKLKSRLHYKWKETTSLSKKNNADWLHGGDVIDMLRSSHGYRD